MTRFALAFALLATACGPSMSADDESSNATSALSGSNDPYNAAYCSGPEITKAEALAHFKAGASSATLGTVTNVARSRACNTQTGCGTWNVMSYDTPLTVQLETDDGLDVDVWLSASPTSSPFACGDLANLDCSTVYEPNIQRESTTLTNHCFRYEMVYQTSPDNTGAYTEFERVWPLKF